jgi:hypothetical protein
MRPSHLSLLLVWACTPHPAAQLVAPAPPVASAVPCPATPSPLASASPPPPPTATVDLDANLLPGADETKLVRNDGTDVPRTRKPTAVLLFAQPSARSTDDEEGLRNVASVRFQPVACSIRGTLAFGAKCGEAMPAKAVVRLTRAGDISRGEIELRRSKVPFVDPFDDTAKPYPAPYAPACCMYKGCFGKTVPYFFTGATNEWFLETTKTILAVWPADADIGLVPMTTVEAGAASGAWDGSCPGVFFGGCRLLSTTDIDGDGRPELLIYEKWVNNYGLAVKANRGTTELYRFSCGSV